MEKFKELLSEVVDKNVEISKTGMQVKAVIKSSTLKKLTFKVGFTKDVFGINCLIRKDVMKVTVTRTSFDMGSVEERNIGILHKLITDFLNRVAEETEVRIMDMKLVEGIEIKSAVPLLKFDGGKNEVLLNPKYLTSNNLATKFNDLLEAADKDEELVFVRSVNLIQGEGSCETGVFLKTRTNFVYKGILYRVEMNLTDDGIMMKVFPNGKDGVNEKIVPLYFKNSDTSIKKAIEETHKRNSLVVLLEAPKFFLSFEVFSKVLVKWIKAIDESKYSSDFAEWTLSEFKEQGKTGFLESNFVEMICVDYKKYGLRWDYLNCYGEIIEFAAFGKYFKMEYPKRNNKARQIMKLDLLKMGEYSQELLKNKII